MQNTDLKLPYYAYADKGDQTQPPYYDLTPGLMQIQTPLYMTISTMK